MSTRPIVAVVPFGARGTSPRAGAIARQIARRIVDRFASETALELRPVFLVAMPEASSDAGYLVFGSSPDAALAAQYAASSGATHALTATFREDGAARVLEASLVDAKSATAGAYRVAIAEGGLQGVETEIAAWVARTLGVTPSVDLATPPTENEAAYVALLEAMDEEVNATLLRPSDPTRAREALQAALARYVDAARADPASDVPEERVLVVAAESLERGDVAHEVHALEELVTVRPRSWRAHYILGQLRAEAGDLNGAILATEHAHAIRPLPDADLVRLAELYANAGAPAPGLAHLRRVREKSPAYGQAQELLAIISLQRGDLETGRAAFDRAVVAGVTSWELHASFGAAVHTRGLLDEAIARYRDALAAGGPPVVRLNLARVLLAKGDRDAALVELDGLLGAERTGEAAMHAQRLRFGLREPDLERELERAGKSVLAGETATLDAARMTFERALERQPDLWEAHFGLGIVARQRGEAAAAQSAFRRVLELWPDQPDALHELGVALLMGNDFTEALQTLDHAAALRPDEAAYIADAGFAHLRAGDLVNARARLERAARLDANDPITKSYLGELARVESEAGKTS
jgi:Flp pilus assembly protein TadD